MWAASHRNGPLCTVSWTRDRVRSFEDDDVALLAAFCNSAVANLARKDAVHTMQTKSKFMESISHELRSPIHGILASAELLESRCTDEESQSLLSDIQISGATLLDTMNQLLVFTEMGNKERVSLKDGGVITTIDGDMTNGMCRTNLGTLIEEVVDSISLGHTVRSAHGKDLEMKRKGLPSNRTLHNALAPIVTVVTIHPEAAEDVLAPVGVLRRLLMIFFSNALSYTSHGHIEVELCLATKPDEAIGRAVQLIVRDSGRGISQRYQDSHMFLPFSQEDATSSGVGLGLSIAHRFVRSFGGTIDVESKEDVGTTMEVTIPFSDLFALDSGSGATNAYLPALLRDYVQGRSVCFINTSGELSRVSEPRPKPSINDSTYDVLARSLEITLTECFGMRIVTATDSPEAHLEIHSSDVFISRAQNPQAREFKVQTPYVQLNTS
jgi:signal transduction histidine kinase